MKNNLLIITGLLVIFHSAASAQSSKAQLGVIINSPTGISGKVWLDARNAFDGAFGWSIAENSSIYFHTDFLRHHFDMFSVEGGKLPLYWGVGAKFTGAHDFFMGIRVPLGASYIYGDSLFDVFFEIVPFINVTPDPVFSLDGAIGFRLFL